MQQTINTTSTQMNKIGVYVSNMTDKLLKPGKYFTAAEFHAQRLNAVRQCSLGLNIDNEMYSSLHFPNMAA